tara:strand:+ start:61 stop:576 length:516 start_codon:yes stop_codon:yes gene_type:complete
VSWRIGTILTLCLFVGFFTGIGIKWAYESTTFKPYEWKGPPVIANCYGDDFSELQMVRAIEYWTLRGHEIAFYEHNPPESLCESKEMIHGFIVLRKAKWWQLDGPTLANTRRMTSGLRLVAATITYRAGSQNLDLLNEHELGHALGYAHVEVEGHIMHPIYGKMGPKFWIP